jgi:two-component system KDP operon response regulator KdpE
MTGTMENTELKILAVDDDPVIRTLIRAILAQADDPAIQGALLREAGTLGEARRILAGEPIDLLLLDVHLPDGLGLDLAAELRRRPGDRPAIVALTASVLPTDQQAALNAGCDAFLAKPYPATALVSICSELATQRARTQAARTVEPR